MSLVSVFGHFYSNKNLAVELSKFLELKFIVRLTRLSKKCQAVYSQDIIWWIHLHKDFPELRCVDKFITN